MTDGFDGDAWRRQDRIDHPEDYVNKPDSFDLVVDAAHGTARLTMFCCEEPITVVLIATNEAVRTAVSQHWRTQHGHTGPELEIPDRL